MNAITDVNTAKAVLTTAKENSVWEAPIPSDESKLLKDATFVYDQAVTAWNNGMRGKAVSAVKFSAEVDGKPVLPDEDDKKYVSSDYKVSEVVEHLVELEVEGDIEEIERIGGEDDRKGVQRAVDATRARLEREFEHEREVEGELQNNLAKDEEKVAYPTRPDNIDTGSWTPKSKFNQRFEAEQFARAEAAKLNLPVPEKVDDIPIATLSRGVANLTVTELAERLTDASLCLAAATWQTALAEIDEEHAERVGQHYFNIEYAKAAPLAKNVQAAQAKAEEVEEVKRWREAEAEAHSRYLAFRALKEVYKGTYDTISRVFAMKQEASERHR